MSHRESGYVVKKIEAITTAVDATTSGGVTIISVNCTGCTDFAVFNSGSVNVFVAASPNGVFFQPSVSIYRVAQNGGAGAPTSAVEALSASTIAIFSGYYQAVRVVANSGSGVYRAGLVCY